MGYSRERPVYKLVFEDPEFAGLEVVAKSGSMRQYTEISQLAQLRNTASKKSVEQIDRLFDTFGSVLVGWNYEEPEGNPLPATAQSLKDLDYDFALRIILAWLDAVGGVAPPLGQPSEDGSPSLEQSLPMEPLSPSL